MSPRSIVTVHAHPDDESSKGPATIARYGAAGARTTLVCCTDGAEGEILNPAVTLAFAVTKKFPWKKVPAYFAGQYLGAFVASIFVYFVYWGKFI